MGDNKDTESQNMWPLDGGQGQGNEVKERHLGKLPGSDVDDGVDGGALHVD